jgi:serine/threonine protein kinase
VANLERSGRASDMFSLGCVLLEAMVFDQDGSLTRLRPESPTTRFVYHESLEKLNDWLPWPEDLDPVKHHLCLAIRGLLSIFPKQRPSADELVSQISLCDNMTEDTCDRIFSNCCRILYFNERHFESRIKALQVQILDLRQEKQIGQQTQKEHVIFTVSSSSNLILDIDAHIVF